MDLTFASRDFYVDHGIQFVQHAVQSGLCVYVVVRRLGVAAFVRARSVGHIDHVAQSVYFAV